MTEDDEALSAGPAERRVLFAVAIGAVVGAVARYEAGRIWATRAGTFPWTTFGINALGCALIGVLIVIVRDVVTDYPLLRPLLGTGVLGGFTTFSTYAFDIQRLAAVSLATGLTRLAVGRAGPTGGRSAR